MYLLFSSVCNNSDLIICLEADTCKWLMVPIHRNQIFPRLWRKKERCVTVLADLQWKQRAEVISTSLAVCPAAPEDADVSKAGPSDTLNDFLGCKVVYFSKLEHKGQWLKNWFAESYNHDLRWKYGSEEWSTWLGVVILQLFGLIMPSKVWQTCTSPIFSQSVWSEATCHCYLNDIGITDGIHTVNTVYRDKLQVPESLNFLIICKKKNYF